MHLKMDISYKSKIKEVIKFLLKVIVICHQYTRIEINIIL